jgi:amyloid beta precursor protein binding protein 1
VVVPADQDATTYLVRAMLDDRTPGTTAAVVLINQPASELAKVEEALANVADVFIVTIVGTEFVGRYDVWQPAQAPIENVHRESDRLDLRIGDPFSTLRDAALEACASLNSLDDHEHAHVPWPYLLVWAVAQWRETTGSAEMPKSSSERSDVRAIVQAVARSPAQENVTEAVANVHRLWNVGQVPSTARDAMKAALRMVRSCALPPHDGDARWWLQAAAVGLFVDRTGHLPLSPSLPDVTATSAGYARLQRLYSARATVDAAEVHELLCSLRATDAPTAPEVSVDDVRSFCATAHSIGVTTVRSRGETDAAAAAQLADTSSLAHLYFALGAYGQLADSLRSSNTEPEAAVAQLQRAASQCAQAAAGGADVEVAVEAVQRVVQGGGAVPHVLGALMGGIVSQEMIKLFTRQFVPVASTLVFDGATGSTLTF